MTQSSCKRDTKSKSHAGMKLAPVRVFSCKHPLNNRIGTRKLVANIKHHLGLRGRNFESRPTSLDVRRNRREIRVQAGPQTFNHGASNRISQPLQGLNLLAECLRQSELRLTR